MYQIGLPSGLDISSIIITVVLVIGGIILLKIGLSITKAQEKKDWKWVAGSFTIQFVVAFFIGSPLMILGISGDVEVDVGAIIPVVLVAAFIDFNFINVLHKVGMKRSLIIMILIIGPIVGALYLIGQLLPSLLF
ncbi:MAG: hypothetical protein ACXADU_03570 [Promethearchaeota archaeon]|jgi:hypothetical protein